MDWRSHGGLRRMSREPEDGTGNRPADKRKRRDDQHRGNKYARDLIGKSLSLGLGALRLLDKANDAGKHRVGANPGCLYTQHSSLVDGGADDCIAYIFRAGRLSPVSIEACLRRHSFQHHTVGRYFFAGPHDHLISRDAPAESAHPPFFRRAARGRCWREVPPVG